MVALVLLGLALLVALFFFVGWFRAASPDQIKRLGKRSLFVGLLVVTIWLIVTGRFWLLLLSLPGLLASVLKWFPLVRFLKSLLPQGADDKQAKKTRAQGQNMSREDALAILGLEDDASPEQIRTAHKQLMRKLHPDQGGTTWLAARLNQAKEVLLNG